jgi:hypothetical protein
MHESVGTAWNATAGSFRAALARQGQKLASQRLERTSDLQAQKRPLNPSRFKFEQVNEVTWKLTNGEITDTQLRMVSGAATKPRKHLRG